VRIISPPGEIGSTRDGDRARPGALDAAARLWGSSSHWRGDDPTEGDDLVGDRHLTLVLGLGASGDAVHAVSGVQSPALCRSADADRTIPVHLKLQDASMSVIDAAELLADTCACQSDEAAVLDKMLGVIDELNDVIRALHATHDRQSASDARTMVGDCEDPCSELGKVFRRVGGNRLFWPNTTWQQQARSDRMDESTIQPPVGSKIFRGKADVRPQRGRCFTGTNADGGSGEEALRADDADRFLAALIDSAEDEAPSLTSICRSATRLLLMNGASVVLMDDGTVPSVAGAYGVSATVQDLEFTLGEGPASDAYTEGRPVLVDDLRSFSSRWPQFTRAVAETEVRSVFALPLQLGAIKLGVLVLYRSRPGVLEGEKLSAALMVADLVTDQLLALQAGVVSESLAWGLEVDDYRAVVHQATGMISAQLDCAVSEALVRLRGQAFATDRPIDQVAVDVVTGELRFDES
jgi:hypothetical protein